MLGGGGGGMECSRTRSCLHSSVSILSPTELYTLKGCCVVRGGCGEASAF